MKTRVLGPALAGVLFFGSGGLFALGERTLIIGGEAGWSAVETRRGVVSSTGYRPHAVLLLDSSPAEEAGIDLSLSFDEDRPDRFSDAAGHYAIMVSPRVESVPGSYARAGSGAALFTGGPGALVSTAARDVDPLVITPVNAGALLARDRRLTDFTLEFWLRPVNMETGGQILYWSAVRAVPDGANEAQWIQCAASRDRLEWTFHNFFASSRDDRRLGASLTGISPVTPGVWSRHQVRFTAATGSLEYLVNGVTESLVYLTSTGREGAEVYTPIIGRGSRMVLGGRYSGFMDEFRFYSGSPADPGAVVDRGAGEQRRGRKYPPAGGRFETAFLDMGEPGSRVVTIDARAGLLRNFLDGRREVLPAFFTPADETGRFDFPDASAIRFFARTADTPWPGSESVWRPIAPGAALDLRGRYVQIGVELYPSGDGENTPWLEEIRLVWLANAPPRPPVRINAVAGDGVVELSWSAGVDRHVDGYLVYYGTESGEYFGTAARAGASPINAGKRTSLRIEGLSNGVLYYFTVSAYDSSGTLHAGEFSREVSARPLRMIE
ncbi:MAG: hypothetical protein LBC88_06845 [Spirochaetaceae bacterium]|jgi:hypothetical protein|nr:hypothetical protein [Spirochaetaceae bacterium]